MKNAKRTAIIFIVIVLALVLILGLFIVMLNIEKDTTKDLKEKLSSANERTVTLETEIEELKKTINVSNMESKQFVGKVANDFLSIINDYKYRNYDRIKKLTLKDFPYDIEATAPYSSKLVEQIFQEGENISISYDQYSRSTFILKDENGNEISGAYFIKDGNYYYVSVIMVAELLDQKIKSFVKALKEEDKSGLTNIIRELELAPTDADVLNIINQYKKSYDLKSLECEFARANGNGFEYKLTGMKDNLYHEEIITVSFDDWWITIMDYKGRSDWKKKY